MGDASPLAEASIFCASQSHTLSEWLSSSLTVTTNRPQPLNVTERTARSSFSSRSSHCLLKSVESNTHT